MVSQEQDPSHTNGRHHVISPFLTWKMGLRPLNDQETLPASQATRIISWYGAFFPVPISADAKDFILIDGGMGGRARNLNRFLGTRGLSLANVHAVFLTHAHVDHVGAIKALMKSSKVTTYVSKEDAPVLRGNQKISEGPIPGKLNRAHLLSAAVPGAITEVIHNTDSVQFDDLKVRAFAMGGHTSGSLAFLVSRGDDRGGDLFVGDALDFDSRGNVVNAAEKFTADQEVSAASIQGIARRLGSYNVQAVIPSHSGHGSFEAVQAFRPEL